LDEAKNQGCPTISITNHQNSPLANISDFCIPLHTNSEKATAATKTYTASLCALALLSVAFSNDASRLREVENLPDQINATLSESMTKMHLVQRYRYIDHTVVIGRGYNYSTAFEIALKIKELSKVISEPYSSADFLHGPIAMIKTGFPVMIIAPSGKAFLDLSGFAHNTKKRGGELIVISDQDKFLKLSALSLKISKSPEWISPITAVIPGQLFARQLAIEKGLNPDRPDGITKVTETY
jgi:glucosamine--fructose-6-phosphate aminotransferase (isomerizing)